MGWPAGWRGTTTERSTTRGLYGRALSRTEVDAIAAGVGPTDAVAAWDFAADIETDRVRNTTGQGLDGRTMNLPTRAVTGHLWDATEMDYTRARAQYGAIYFHDDDLLDSRWDVGFAFEVPESLRSGVYAARLRTTTSEDYVPFFVRPPRGTATADIALLIPTVSYLAYAGTGGGGGFGSRTMSLYSTHTDGSGVTYSSRLRPITNMRPKIDTRNPWQFMADTHLVDWLEVQGFTVDVITDIDLHAEGAELLGRYNCGADGDASGVLLVGDAPGDADLSRAGWPPDVHGGQRLLLGDAGRPDRHLHRGAAARRDRALARGAGGELPQPDRGTRGPVAVSREGATVAGRGRVHGAGVRPELAVRADAGQLRPTGGVHLRRDRGQRADREPSVAGAGVRGGGVGAGPGWTTRRERRRTR